MTGTIILPAFLSKLWVPENVNGNRDFRLVSNVASPFFYALKDELGFDLRYSNEIDVPHNTDMVILFGGPYHNKPKPIPGLLDLNKKTKLVIYPGDLQTRENADCLKNKINAFERCDLILSGSYEYFAKMYPMFLSKHRFLPLFFGPDDRYLKLNFNNDPNMKCLLPGASGPNVYPLRSFVKKNYIGINCMRKEGDSYAELLNSFFCCVTSSSIFNYVVAKYFEIPAAGSLLLANETFDLDKIGFVPHEHYVPITKENVINTIKHCLNNSSEYDHIRKRGMDYVRAHHSMTNRVNEFVKILKDSPIS